MTLQERLELSIETKGLSSAITLKLSQERDLEVVKEQQAIYNKLVQEGILRKMAREFKNPSRQQQIFETIRRVEEM